MNDTAKNAIWGEGRHGEARGFLAEWRDKKRRGPQSMEKTWTEEEKAEGMRLGMKILKLANLRGESLPKAETVRDALKGETPEPSGGFVGAPTSYHEIYEISAQLDAKGRTELYRWGASPWPEQRGVRGDARRVVSKAIWNLLSYIYGKNGVAEGEAHCKAAWRWAEAHSGSAELLTNEIEEARSRMQGMSQADGILGSADQRALNVARIWLSASLEREGALKGDAKALEAAREMDREMESIRARKEMGGAKKKKKIAISEEDRERAKTLALLCDREWRDKGSFMALGAALAGYGRAPLLALLKAGANPWTAAGRSGNMNGNPLAWGAHYMAGARDPLESEAKIEWAKACLEGAASAFSEDPKGKCQEAAKEARELLKGYPNSLSVLAEIEAAIEATRLGEALSEAIAEPSLKRNRKCM